MSIRNLIFACLLLASSFAQAKSIVCWSKEVGKRPLEISFNQKAAKFSFAEDSCTLTRVEYKPRSEDYAGWIRFSNQNSINKTSGSTSCRKVMGAYYTQLEPHSTDLPDVHWISLSTEVQASGDGRLQLGYQNLWDPGAGGTGKMMLGCRPAR